MACERQVRRRRRGSGERDPRLELPGEREAFVFTEPGAELDLAAERTHAQAHGPPGWGSRLDDQARPGAREDMAGLAVAATVHNLELPLVEQDEIAVLAVAAQHCGDEQHGEKFERHERRHRPEALRGERHGEHARRAAECEQQPSQRARRERAVVGYRAIETTRSV